MWFDVMTHYEELADQFEENKQEKLHEIFESVEFKLNKNSYHIKNIRNLVDAEGILEKQDFYKEVHIPLYYEMENVLVSLRSSVDVILHLIKEIYDLNLGTQDVYLGNVYNHKKLPKTAKNIFNRFTRPYNNPKWHFIYSARNEIVHEKSVHQVLPINIDLFTADHPIVLFEFEGFQKEMFSFFNQCLRFLDSFFSELMQAVKLSFRQNRD